MDKATLHELKRRYDSGEQLTGEEADRLWRGLLELWTSDLRTLQEQLTGLPEGHEDEDTLLEMIYEQQRLVGEAQRYAWT